MMIDHINANLFLLVKATYRPTKGTSFLCIFLLFINRSFKLLTSKCTMNFVQKNDKLFFIEF